MGKSSRLRGALFVGIVAVDACALAHCGSSSSNGAAPKDGGPVDVSAQDARTAADASDSGDGASDAGRICTANTNKIGTTTRTAGGEPYLAYVPASYDASKPNPLVVALHPTGVAIDYYLTQFWQANADSQGFLVITPAGTDLGGGALVWRPEDEAAVLAAIDDFSACYSVDPRRIILDGYSGGAVMSYWLGLRHAKRFAGISIQAADLASAEAVNGSPLLPAAATIPISHTHGLQDQTFLIPIAEQGRDRLLDAGHPFEWHTFDGGHAGATPQMALQRYMDLEGATATAAQDGVPPLFPASDGGDCNDVPNSAPPIQVQQVASDSPTPMGGPTPVDGTYFATALTIYTGAGGPSGPAGVTYQTTIVLSGGTSYVVSFTSSNDAGTLHSNYGPSTYLGTAASLTETCPYIQKPTWTAYDSDATHLTLYSSATPAAGVQAMTLTKQ